MSEKTPEEIAIERIEEAHRTKADELDLIGLDIRILPDAIWKLTHLNHLFLSHNKIIALPTEVGQLSALTTLDISYNQITSLPVQVGQLSNLSWLDISYNQLHILPPEIGELTHLTFLNLHSNQLVALPPEIGCSTNLTYLDLSDNELTSLPPEIGKLIKLDNLILRGNQLVILPKEVGQLVLLSSLDLFGNQLTTIPVEIGQLISLGSLDLRFNHLTTIPSELGLLSNLFFLFLSNRDNYWIVLSPRGNRIETLPKEIQNLKSLRKIDLRDNSLQIPSEILEKTDEPKSILNYITWILDGKRKAIGETKMLVVGQGSVGKTSLIKYIISESFDPKETKTDGIAIDYWKVENHTETENQSPEITLRIWDFGGQEIMHATHQFFLTKRSLYLLVLDARLTQEENRVEYWLKIIQSFGSESPVLIVGNKIDQHPLDIDRTGLQKKYPNIVGILETSAATGAGVEALKIAIAEQVNNLPHIRAMLPETWFTVKAKLEGLGNESNFITHDKYLELCAETEVNDEISQRTLLGFLHDLGVVLHFQDDPRLEALGILNPQWVTNGVYKILNSHTLFQNKGVLERAMLDEILNFPEYPANKHLFIVDMMRKFELCYDIEPDKTFLIPDLLPKDEPFIGEWDKALAFQYHYNILPSSIISRFIVRMNTFIYKTVWRSGVVLQKGGNTALIKADAEEKKIYIWVNGDKPTCRDFLSVIRAELDAIHKTISKIEAIEKVPHPDFPELILDYNELLQFERDGIAQFPKSVNRKTIMIDVHQLLNGISPVTDRLRISVSDTFLKEETYNALTDDNKDLSEIPTMEKPFYVEHRSEKKFLPTKSKFFSLKTIFSFFVSIPEVIGRAGLDIVGRDKASDSTAILLGCGLIIIAALLFGGILDFNLLIKQFKDLWQFFVPVK